LAQSEQLRAALSVALAESEATVRALREHSERFQQVFDGMLAAVLVAEVIYTDGVATGHRLLTANRAFTEITGVAASDVVGRSMLDFNTSMPAELMERFYRVAETGESFEFERHSDRLRRTLEARVFSPVRGQFAISFTDVTVRRQLEEQMRQAQRMEAVGRLAGGIAHDFNNMLGVIIGRTELAMLETEPASQVHEDLTEIVSAARRSADLTRQLLAFARKQTLSPKVLDLSAALSRATTLLRRVVGEDIALVSVDADASCAVLIDPGSLDQILVNLCLNARDAIRRARRDTDHVAADDRIELMVQHRTLDAAYAAQHPEAAPGSYICLSVRDTGCGIAPSDLTRIFEPFYTTKGVGEGSGLGLPMVLGTVQQSGGFMVATSELGQGATFELFFPARHEPLAPPTEAPTELVGGAETILVAEDEAAVLQLAVQSLTRLGYRVLGAHGPIEALHVAMAFDGPIDLLLTDVVMPEMHGSELAHQLRAVRPSLRVLFMSGYSADVLHEESLRDGSAQFLPKPFSLGELATKIRQTLHHT